MAEQFEGPVDIDGELNVRGQVDIGNPADPLGPGVSLDVFGLIFSTRGLFVQPGGHIEADRVNARQVVTDTIVHPEGLAHQVLVDGGLGVELSLNVDGDINVLGDIKLLGADVAEQFEVVGEVQAYPGSVVVLAGADQVCVSNQPYDRRVAGVVSGAGTYRPALVLNSQGDSGRRPLALTGKVWCNVDADWAPIEIGDLLTTSATPGHAMRALDEARSFGAVIGKALGRLESGRGLIPVLVSLQ